jgi:hypothetical protein
MRLSLWARCPRVERERTRWPNRPTVHTNQSEPLNRQFAGVYGARGASRKYPVYGELRNMFDLAMAVALIESEGLAGR